MQTTDKLTALLAPAIEGLGYELLGIERLGGQGAATLRVYIDNEAGITVDDCAAVSHQVSGILDVEDPITSAYTLEVSSPGVDRPLFTAQQCARFIGEEIALTLGLAVEGRRRFTALLTAVVDDDLHLTHEGEALVVPFSAVQKARLRPNWDQLAKG